MTFKNLLFSLYVKVKHFKPKIFTDEEKKKIIPEMISSNRKIDQNLYNSKKRYIKNLDIKKIDLTNCGSWFVTNKNNPKNKVIYYIHGGGFTGSCSKERISFISYLVNKFGYNVYSIDYRLAPEFKFPNQLNDCLEGYQYLLKTFDSKNIVLIGESAGGSLVITLSMMLRDKNIPLPKSVYANSPVTQFIEYTASYKRNSLKKDFIVVEGIIDNLMGIYCDKKDIYNPYISPLYGDLRNLPPINLTASYDECLYDDALMMSDKLKEAKNEGKLITYKGLCHAFIISPQMKKVVKYAYPDLENFLKNNLN